MTQNGMGRMFDRSIKMAHKADDQPSMAILRTVAAVDAERLSEGGGGMAIVQTDAGSLIGGTHANANNWSFSPRSIRRWRSFGQR